MPADLMKPGEDLNKCHQFWISNNVTLNLNDLLNFMKLFHILTDIYRMKWNGRTKSSNSVYDSRKSYREHIENRFNPVFEVKSHFIKRNIAMQFYYVTHIPTIYIYRYIYTIHHIVNQRELWVFKKSMDQFRPICHI